LDLFIEDKELKKQYNAGASRKFKLDAVVIDKFFAEIPKIEAATTIHYLFIYNGPRFKKLNDDEKYDIRLNLDFAVEIVRSMGDQASIDNFWFTIAHEIARVLRHLDEENEFVLDNLKENNLNEKEVEANSLAAEKLKRNEIIEYLESYLGYLTINKIELCSEDLGIHPAINIGKLAYKKKIFHANQSPFNENVLTLIANKYQEKSLTSE